MNWTGRLSQKLTGQTVQIGLLFVAVKRFSVRREVPLSFTAGYAEVLTGWGAAEGISNMRDPNLTPKMGCMVDEK